jgi:hypothetical protein
MSISGDSSSDSTLYSPLRAASNILLDLGCFAIFMVSHLGSMGPHFGIMYGAKDGKTST